MSCSSSWPTAGQRPPVCAREAASVMRSCPGSAPGQDAGPGCTPMHADETLKRPYLVVRPRVGPPTDETRRRIKPVPVPVSTHYRRAPPAHCAPESVRSGRCGSATCEGLRRAHLQTPQTRDGCPHTPGPGDLAPLARTQDSKEAPLRVCCKQNRTAAANKKEPTPPAPETVGGGRRGPTTAIVHEATARGNQGRYKYS